MFVTHVSVDVLDGAMIVLATFSMNFFHPGWLLGHGDTWKSEKQLRKLQETHSLDTVTDNIPNNTF